MRVAVAVQLPLTGVIVLVPLEALFLAASVLFERGRLLRVGGTSALDRARLVLEGADAA